MRYFYYVSWLIELLVGIGLFAVSFLVQNEVLQAFMSSALLALFLAVVLESACRINTLQTWCYLHWSHDTKRNNEPPWYVIRMLVVWEEGCCEASPYPDYV